MTEPTDHLRKLDELHQRLSDVIADLGAGRITTKEANRRTSEVGREIKELQAAFKEERRTPTDT